MHARFLHLHRAGLLAFACGLLCGLPATGTRAQNRWDDTQIIKRQPTAPNRKPAPRQVRRTAPMQQRAALLTLQWRLLRFTEDGLRRVVNVEDTFSPRDRLVLAIKANQNGYLYVVRQATPERDGQVLFPSRYYNAGRNYVQKDQEFVLPSDCAEFAAPCWFNLQPPSGKEMITLIFSRDEIEELPNFASPNATSLNVRAQLLSNLIAGSQQRLLRIPGVLSDRYTIWVRNTNPDNNEEIIETLTLNKAAPVNTAGATRND